MKAKYEELAEDIVKSSGFSMEQLTTESRKREKVLTRQVVFYILAKHKMASTSAIGRIFARDHATVLHAKKVIANLLATKHPEIEYNLVKTLVTIGNGKANRYNNLPEVQREREGRKAVARWAYRNKLANALLPAMPRRPRYDTGNCYHIKPLTP